jgi:hypothetical protein
VVAHQARDRDRLGVGAARDHSGGHDLAELHGAYATCVAHAEQMRVVPLEAGGGPENPPCPACGEPLFGLISARPGLADPVRACESCGLGVVGEPRGAEAALSELDALRDGDLLRIDNRRGLSAWLGGAGWSALRPGRGHLYTEEAVRRLVAYRDQAVVSARWAPGAGILSMWQTVVNSVTFGRNVATGVLGRPQAAVPAGRRWQRGLDLAISALVAIPGLAIAAPVELLGALVLRRGSALRLRLELL